MTLTIYLNMPYSPKSPVRKFALGAYPRQLWVPHHELGGLPPDGDAWCGGI